MTTALALVFVLGAEVAETPATTVAKILTELRATACGDELACWKRKVLRLDVGLEGAALALDSAQLRLTFADAESGVWRGKAEDARRAIEAIKPAIATPTLDAWHRSPVLWFAVGFVAAVGLALGIFAISARIGGTAQ